MLPGTVGGRYPVMKNVIVIGSGAGGATAARTLQDSFNVTILEAGKKFQPFTGSLSTLETIKKYGLLFNKRQISIAFPVYQIRKTKDKMVLVNGIGTGGTTTICTGNAVRMDGDLKNLGLNLDPEFEEIYREIPVTTGHRKNWRKTTKQLFEICQNMGLSPKVTPKMGHYERCANCGRCILGCVHGVKWDSRSFLTDAINKGATLVTGAKVQRLMVDKGRVTGVIAKTGFKRKFYPADLVVLAAGGLGTPVILQNSGIACDPALFVDPVLCVAARYEGSLQNRELPMPFIVQTDHYIISPYFDHLSFFFNDDWRYPASDTLSLMIKLADNNVGGVSRKGIQKTLTAIDRARLDAGVKVCSDILEHLGIEKNRLFLGTLNAGHPGGMLPVTAATTDSLHDPRLPDNLYVADATLLPKALGNPPILTIIALAKKISKIIKVRLR